MFYVWHKLLTFLRCFFCTQIWWKKSSLAGGFQHDSVGTLAAAYSFWTAPCIICFNLPSHVNNIVR